MTLERGVGRWWHSLYWRVGVSFVAFVVALILAQSAIFIYWMERPGRGNPRLEQLRLAMGIAADVSRALTHDPGTDLAALLQNRGGGRPVYVVLRDGTTAAGSDLPLSDSAERIARMMLRGGAPRSEEELSQRVRTLSQVSLASDMVFADGSALELATVTGSPAGGYTAMLTVAV